MLKKIFLLFLMLLFWAAFLQAETFEESDVVGKWHFYELDVDPIVGSYWLYSDVGIINTQNITGDITAPDGTTMQVISGEASIAPNGSLSGSFTTDIGLTGTIVDGLQDQNHTILSYVSVDTQDALGLGIGIKSGGSYQTSDVMGEWRFYGIDVDPTLPGLYWIVGDATVDAAGKISSGAYTVPDGTTIDMTDGQFSVAPDGEITGSFEFDGNLRAQIVDGVVDDQKTFAAFVYANSKKGLGFDVALKKGGEYQPSDLAGDWKFYNFTIDTVNGLAYWVYGNGTIDSEGNFTGSYTGPDGSVFTISNGQASISIHGELSGSFAVDGVAAETIQSGFMDQNKSIIVFVGTCDNGQMDLGIGFRTSKLPDAVQRANSSSSSSTGAGDGGGCFITGILDP